MSQWRYKGKSTSDSPFERVLSRLPEARPVSRSQRDWMSPCPAHADGKASLSVARGKDGRALVHCYAGCTPEAVTAALGLTLADLMPGEQKTAGGSRAGWPIADCSTPALGGDPSPAGGGWATSPSPARPVDSPDHLLHGLTLAPGGGHILQPEAPVERPKGRRMQEVLAELARQRGMISRFWVYEDSSGEPVGVIARWERPSGKEIRPISRHNGDWIVGGMTEPRPLYHLPELLARRQERVYVTEGEKAVEAGRTIGLLATTSPHGSGSAAKADWSPLAGRDVVLLPDNDDAGRQYARDVSAILAALTPPATVRIVALPELPDKGDLYDWLEAHDAVETDALRERLDSLVEAVAPLGPIAACSTPALGGDPSPAGGGWATPQSPTCEPIVQCLADIAPTAIQWLWPGRMALGRLTILVGRPGEGKSFLTTDMAARVSTGSPWPDGTAAPSGSVLLICAEDDPRDTIRPRLAACGADLTRIHLLSTVRRVERDGQRREVLFNLLNVQALEAVLRQHPDCRLIVVDPIGSFLGGETDAHRDNDVRSVLAPVAKLAERYGPAVLVVAHRRKNGAGTADDLALGSRAFTGIARAVWHLTRDPQASRRRLLLPGKNNLAREGHGLAFAIAGEPSAVQWEKDPVAMTADEALRQEWAEKAASGQGVRGEVMSWLQELLSHGPVPADAIESAAKAAGFGWRTVHRAKDTLGIRTARNGPGGTWMWIPAESAEPAPAVPCGVRS